MRNMYYGDSKTQDLAKYRAEAHQLARGDHRDSARSVTIHFHKYGQNCAGSQHELYHNHDGEVVVERTGAE